MYRTGLAVLIFCFATACCAAKQISSLDSPELKSRNESSAILAVENGSKVNSTKRLLTGEEQEIADRARAQIAEVVTKNLIRFFTVIAATNSRASRQFDEDDDGEEDVTFNPNTLPQVAQLLGAIFAGNLNLTNIVDRAFFLVPDTVRNQVSGIFKLLTGGGGAETAQAPAPPPAVPAPTEAAVPLRVIRPIVPTAEPTEQSPDVVASFVISTPGRNKTKYKIRRKIPQTTHQPIVVGSEEYEIISDDELQRLEKDLVISAKQYEPIVKETPPRDFMGQLRSLFASTNMTSVIRAMPDIFFGARQAFTLLEELGQLDDFPSLTDIFGGDDDDDRK